MELRLEHCTLRSWRASDAPSLVTHGNHHAIWKNMRDAFPSPFSLERARAFIEAAQSSTPETRFAICIDDEAIGSIGITLHTDVERVTAELGYWLAEAHWGKGLATEAIRALTRHAVDAHGLTRVEALPYATNSASARVLEKAGYVLEARMRRRVIKEGQVVDQLLYAFVVE